MGTVTIIRWRFGYKIADRRKRDSLGSEGVGGHGGCWINDYDCGAPDCPMARYDGKPETLTPPAEERHAP
jgi:hypothetical protein